MHEQNKPDELLVVSDLNQFIGMLRAWHENRVSTLNHMMEIPSGTEVTFNKDEPIVLEGDLLRGFCMGITLSLMELGELPFTDNPEETTSTVSNETAPTVH